MSQAIPIPTRPHRRSRRKHRGSKLYRFLDGFTEVVLYFMIIFSPWAFGTTQPWSIWTMNGAGYLLGALLIAKWVVGEKDSGFRIQDSGFRIQDSGDLRPEAEDSGGIAKPGRPHLTLDTGERDTGKPGAAITILAATTILILLYTFIGALNARMLYFEEYGQWFYNYRDCLRWLPHSYNSANTWNAFWDYLGLAFAFWAARDWLLGGQDSGFRIQDSGFRIQHPVSKIPPRLRRLLWILCLNGAVLAIVCILQRLHGTDKLLWLLKPHINQTADAQFGPYAYRSNAAQYFNLVWPLCLAFWWLLRRQAGRHLHKSDRIGGESHMLLLPCSILMAASPIIATSRGGAFIAAAGLIVCIALFILANHGRRWKTHLGILILFAVIIGFAGYLGWEKLEPRLKTLFSDDFSGRLEIYQNAKQMARDYPIYGSGPNTFVTLYQFYRSDASEPWHAYAHDDWLETRITFGWVGFGLILAALLTALLHPFLNSKFLIRNSKFLQVHWIFPAMLYLALGGCLIHARFDFPFQVHSLLFLFLLECAILSVLATKSATANRH